MTICRTLFVSALLVGSALLGIAQEASVVEPRLENRLNDAVVAPATSAGKSGASGFRIQASSLGYSFSSGSPDFNYGDEITPPLVDLAENILTLAEARSYWRAEPARAGEGIQIDGTIRTLLAEGTQERFYYSPHAERLIASQTGSVTLHWITLESDEAGNFGHLKESYTIGLATSLTTRQIYWTEVGHSAPTVAVPPGIVQDLVIAYNDQVPATVRAFDENVPGSVEERVIPANYDGIVPDTTVWYDPGLKLISAYNREGRVIVEYLGDPRGDAGDGLRESLGFEILEVRKELAPITVDTFIGEQILPSRTRVVDPSDLNYTPPAIVSSPAVAQHFDENEVVYYAIQENLQPSNVEIYWFEEGEHTIRWPEIRNHYLFTWPRWPEDKERFEAVFARPNLGTTEDQVAASFLDLKSINTPQLIFQDDPSGNEASVDFQFRLSVALDADGTNRSLIRFNSGNRFWYIRLYSATTDRLKEVDTDAAGAFNPNDLLDFHIARNVLVGQRLEPPHESLQTGGYLDSNSGDAYQPDAYVTPFAEGGIEAANAGAIIPVNALPGNDTLRVWWFRELTPPADRADVFRPIHVPAVIGDYTISYPGNAPEIILASNQGTGDLDKTKVINPRIYSRTEAPGYNPNEEHALYLAGRGYALRDDLNQPTSSKPFVLLAYNDPESEGGRPNMKVFKVLREKLMADDSELTRDIVFNYPAVAGHILEAPMPLPIITQPLEEKIVAGKKVYPSKNEEVTPSGQDPVHNGPSRGNLKHYDDFTFEDRKGTTWVYRGPHSGDTLKKLSFQYYYPVQDGFDFPGDDKPPAVGDIIPYLSPEGTVDPIGNDTPLTITYDPQWPTQTPVLHYGETLGMPKFGLPQILGNSSAQILYQQSVALDFNKATPSVVLHDATRNREAKLSSVGLEKLPASIATSTSRGKVYFQRLPTHLEDRLYYDPLIDTHGALVFQGRFVDELVGEDYAQLNTLTESEIVLLKKLWKSGEDSERQDWEDLIDNLTIEPTFRWLDHNFVERTRTYEEWVVAERFTEVIGQTIKQSFGLNELPHIVDPDQVKHDYLLSAIGGGAGYVTILTGNGRVNSPEEEPIQMHVIRVGEQLYRGELKPLVAANPLSENVTVRHTGDFAARADDYEFEWRKAPPEDGKAPAVFKFVHKTASGVLTELQASRNVAEESGELLWGEEEAAALPASVVLNPKDSDLTMPTYRLRGSLNLSSQVTPSDRLETVFISLSLDEDDGAVLYVNGTQALRYRALEGEDSEIASSIPNGVKPFLTNGDHFKVFKLSARLFQAGEDNSFELHYNTTDLVDSLSTLEARVAVTVKQDVSNAYVAATAPTMVPGYSRHLVSGSGIDTLGDNWYIMRYKPSEDSGHPLEGQWSDWTNPALVEGWIKRVLAGINPFNQRVTDFYENAVDTNISLVSQAGPRWEGDIALTLPAVQEAGLIEIYETVLRRGIDISIKSGVEGVDYAPANDALLLAAGYLNDLYMALGNEAFADATNPTVSFDGQALGTLGDAAVTAGFEENFRNTSTARFAFQGQVPTLLEEELALLRGRDDSLSPSIQTESVYNRMFWNYTRGIDAGELIYALNYNIRELDDEVADGKIDAADAARLYPQGHGDAYGHYLTAVKNYYRLLTDPEFTWGPRIEAVNVLSQPVSIDYFDERKFATAASALARTANQIISLERRRSFKDGNEGWSHLSESKKNDETNTTRHWGVDDWASRGAQGAYYHWLIGNAILPEEDTVHEGIQKIDRITVPELGSIASAAAKIQLQLEAADARVNPLDLRNDDLLFDISPSELGDGKTHFEQIYERAVAALNNAHAVFDRAGDSTRLLRSLENQSQNLTQVIADEEQAFTRSLFDIYGEPYAGDVGAGRLYPQEYNEPDFLHYTYIDRPFDIFTKDYLFAYPDDGARREFTVNILDLGIMNSFDMAGSIEERFGSAIEVERTVAYTLREDQGPYTIANPELGKRPAVGSLQRALNEVRLSEEQLYVALQSMEDDRSDFEDEINALIAEIKDHTARLIANETFSAAKFVYEELLVAIDAIKDASDLQKKSRDQAVKAAVQSLPTVVGLSNDVTAPVRAAILSADIAAGLPNIAAAISAQISGSVADLVFVAAEKALEIAELSIDEAAYFRSKVDEAKRLYSATLAQTHHVDALLVAYTRALEDYRSQLAAGEALRRDRETFRHRGSAAVQGYRTRDIAFRTFRTEALEEYQTLFDWASRYAFLAAQAYDYETGLLGSKDGQAFLGDIISSRALGVVGPDGQPTLSASSTGDAGLSGLLAKLKADYDVVKGRLGFNNPESNGTTFSLRRELFRIPETADGDIAWQQVLEGLVEVDLLRDATIATHAMQLGGNEASPQPGFLVEFPTLIEDGKNFFGKTLAAGDSTFTTSNFATKISSLGIVFDGYHGMAPCPICLQADHGDALSATPYVYLIPAGDDTMRTPPLGDGQALRNWMVRDYAMPLPFDLGSFEPSNEAVQQSMGSLRASFREPRRHAAFRATDIVDYFYTGLADDYTSSRLVGRSVWNSKWKLAIPAKGLLFDETEGIARFIRSVKDIKLHLKTYSYSGN